ncbi:MAG: response regulator [Ardenticatenaceae bacterium]|nr:response regulator [Ardenticatenaceae bacterium]
MPYKVFLVEDEIVAREGIRDNVDWRSAGFEFCGEAPDGEIALPLIKKVQPDVIITDIKMPFMDGLQLCKIVRQQMPWVKIIILSGHDEFDYAQSAIKLGVTEYLLKPIGTAEIQGALQSVGAILNQESAERKALKDLQSQIKDARTLQQEKMLLQLVVGGVSSTAVIEQCRQIGLEIVAQHYLVVLIKIHLPEEQTPADFASIHEIPQMVSNLVSNRAGVFFTQKSVEEMVLILCGEDAAQLRQDGLLLADLVQKEVAGVWGQRVSVGVGDVQQRLTDIFLSFAEAVTAVSRPPLHSQPATPNHLTEMLRREQSAIEQYLKSGLLNEFEPFFADHLYPLGEAALQSPLIKHYLFVDLILAAAELVAALGGEAKQVIPAMADMEGFLANINTLSQMREAARTIFSAALTFRNDQVQYEKAKLIFQAKEFIDAHFTNPNLVLNDVAATVNLSPSHFSVVFGRETGESFKDYLTRIRIERAKELLRTTNIKCSEVALQSGYSDPHYFSYVFRKNTGLPPQQFRQLPRA